MHFLTPLKAAHPAGLVTFAYMSISPIDYMYSAEPGSLHLPASLTAVSHTRLHHQQTHTHICLLAFFPPCRAMVYGQPTLGGIDFKQMNTSQRNENKYRKTNGKATTQKQTREDAQALTTEEKIMRPTRLTTWADMREHLRHVRHYSPVRYLM